jgi:hypothetical protein
MELTSFLVILLIVAFAGGGVYLIISALTVGRKARTHVSWPAVKGKVLSSEIVESSGLSPEGIPFSTFKPVTRFLYIVNRVEYVSIQIGPALRQGNDPVIHQIMEQYPVGKGVVVHFDPENPHEAILAPHIPVARPVLMAGIGLLFVSVMLACFGLIAFLFYFFTH